MEANTPDFSPAARPPAPLGSLSQAARGNELKRVQRILFVIGVLTMAVNGFSLYNFENEIQQAIRQNQIAPQFIQETRISGYLVYGLPAFLGLLFVIFGVIIKRFPVLITITSLVLYIIAQAAFGYLAPASLFNGFIVKILIIYALFQAIKAARAFEAHTQKPEVAEELLA